MSKEYNFIREVRQQPDVVRESLDFADRQLGALAKKYCGKIDRIILAGCGDSYMLGIPAVYAFERWSKIPAEAIEAAELSMDRHYVIDEQTLVILISSSGKSIRVIDAGEVAKKKGAQILALVNQIPSPLAEAADEAIQTQAGHTNAYPSKTTTTAIAILYSLALHLAENSQTLTPETISFYRSELYKQIPGVMNKILQTENEMNGLAEKYARAPIYSFIGSGPNMGTALLAAAKMGETSQSLSRATNLEEFSHLHGYTIQENEPIFMIDGPGEIGERGRLMAEVIIANGGKVIVVGLGESKEQWGELPETYIEVPVHTEMFGPLVNWLPLQIFAYYIGIHKGRNPDKPARFGTEDVQKIIYGGMLDGYDDR
jgi:glucosamine--fructose-6-phosphate aminotransferase (isomerizing)